VTNDVAILSLYRISVILALLQEHQLRGIDEEANGESLGLNSLMVGLWVTPLRPPLPLLVVNDLVEHGAEQGAEGPLPCFGQTRGSADPWTISLSTSLGPSTGMMARGVVEMYSTSSSTPTFARAWFVGEGSRRGWKWRRNR
jgi:hypothetical protein